MKTTGGMSSIGRETKDCVAILYPTQQQRPAAPQEHSDLFFLRPM